MQNRVTDYFIYRHRYILGYFFIVAALFLVVVMAGFYVPGALRQGEVDAALKSGALSVESLSPDMVIDLPYHVLQRVGFILFGVSTFTIKLPSIILGIATIIGLFFLVRTWFRRNIAILATVIAATSTQFLFLLQDGTPNIMFSFLTIWLLFAATYVTRKKTFGTFWKVLTGVLMATALYTPLGVYLVIAVLTTTFFHPHIRHLVLRFSRPRLWIGIALGVVSIIPLIYASILDPSTLQILLGFPTEGGVNLSENLATLGLSLFGFAAHSEGYMLRPVYSLGLFLLMSVGLYKLITYKYTARSYVTLVLSAMLIPLIVINPLHVTHLFPLASLMIALGLATLITNWYKLFPRNPYARVAGLIPLSILVLGIIFSGITRYASSYLHNPAVLSDYSFDLRLLTNELNQRPTDSSLLLVSAPSELPLYTMVSRYDSRLRVSHKLPDKLLNGTTIFYTHDAFAYANDRPSLPITNIITDHLSLKSDRFYVYKFTDE
ncbi:hypothetical protein EOL96_02485 [Candidatus Saccharibacteria bacterium]|nr:hypothetical protein [Candidatus Saccharibacteria bacterium]